MRGINLGRLARSSESSYFSQVQTSQAAQLRKSMTAEQIAAARKSEAKSEVTVDTVASIAGQSAYRRLVEAEAGRPGTPITRGYVKTILTRMRDPTTVDQETLAKSTLQTSGKLGFAPDAGIMQALGQNKLNRYARLRESAAPLKTLSVSDATAEGAIIGVHAFLIATALVGSVGIGGMVYVYKHPSVIDRVRERTMQLREGVEYGFIGTWLRGLSESLRQDGALMSPHTAETMRQVASKVIEADAEMPSEKDREADTTTAKLASSS